eukprot:g21249.t1
MWLMGGVAATLAYMGIRYASRPREADQFRWLEDVHGDRALAWVKEQNKLAIAELGDPTHTDVFKKILAILDSKDKIPLARKIGDYLYNFWQDEKHVDGIWRRCKAEEYLAEHVRWETVLDLDLLSKTEGKKWVWKGYTLLDLEGEKPDRALLSLSPGGSDAVSIREFDLVKKAFVTDHPFNVDPAKTRVSWKSRDMVLIGTDFGPGSLTSSGYPRQMKEWKRGTPLAAAELVFEVKTDDLAANSWVSYTQGVTREWRSRSIDFYSEERYLKRGGEFKKLDIPADMETGAFAGCLLFKPRSEWTFRGLTYKQGSLLSITESDFFGGSGHVTTLFAPTKSRSLADYIGLKTFLIIEILEDVKSVQEFWELVDGIWHKRRERRDLGLSSVSMWAYDRAEDNQYWIQTSGFTQPPRLQLCAAASPAAPAGDSKAPAEHAPVLKALPAQFDATGLQVEQLWCSSPDGTHIPYFLVAKKNLPRDGNNPTLLYGYGGFEISLLPYYASSVGAGWLERGGVFVSANIRGGGEYGPAWHQAVLKEKRYKCYEDFIAVAEDLIRRNITSPARLGCMGGSNGGLLVGNMLTRRPDLFAGIVCQVPLLDMRRYNQLLAGASWMAEYGNPDIEAEWEGFLRFNSPYHNVQRRSERKYPAVLFTTSTRDDRVHPAHARKMVARLKYKGHPNILYWENMEGGHAGAADNKQRAYMNALSWMFLARTLKLKP